MVVQIVRFKSGLAYEQLMKAAEEGAPDVQTGELILTLRPEA